jgi:hypothetical protein
LSSVLFSYLTLAEGTAIECNWRAK